MTVPGCVPRSTWTNPRRLSGGVVNADAYSWVQKYEPGRPRFDVVIIDFPDPHNYSLGKLYTTHFYRLLRRHLADGAVIGIQCTSPFMAPKTFWCIVRTMESVGFKVRPYHAAVPSFLGIWGFALAKQSEFEPPRVELALERAGVGD